ELCEQIATSAQFCLLGQLTHVGHTPFLAHRFECRAKPLISAAFHGDLPLPLGLQQIIERLWHAGLCYCSGIVAERAIIRVCRRPVPLWVFIAFPEKFALGRIIGREQSPLFNTVAVETRRYDHIAKVLPGAVFVDESLHEGRIIGAIVGRIDFRIDLFERVQQSFRVGGGEGRVHHQLAFRLRLCPHILCIRWKTSKPTSSANGEKQRFDNSKSVHYSVNLIPLEYPSPVVLSSDQLDESKSVRSEHELNGDRPGVSPKGVDRPFVRDCLMVYVTDEYHRSKT